MSEGKLKSGTIVEVSTRITGFLNKCKHQNISREYLDIDNRLIDKEEYIYDKKKDRLYRIYDLIDHNTEDAGIYSITEEGYIDFVAAYYNGACCLEDVILDIVKKVEEQTPEQLEFNFEEGENKDD